MTAHLVSSLRAKTRRTFVFSPGGGAEEVLEAREQPSTNQTLLFSAENISIK